MFQQLADRLALLPGDGTLLLPKIPVSDALVVFDVQEFVGRDRGKVSFYLIRLNVLSFILQQVTIKRLDHCMKQNRNGATPVCAWSQPINLFERTRKGLIGGKAIV